MGRRHLKSRGHAAPRLRRVDVPEGVQPQARQRPHALAKRRGAERLPLALGVEEAVRAAVREQHVGRVGDRGVDARQVVFARELARC